MDFQLPVWHGLAPELRNNAGALYNWPALFPAANYNQYLPLSSPTYALMRFRILTIDLRGQVASMSRITLLRWQIRLKSMVTQINEFRHEGEMQRLIIMFNQIININMSFLYNNTKIIVYINVIAICAVIFKWEKRVAAFSHIGTLYLRKYERVSHEIFLIFLMSKIIFLDFLRHWTHIYYIIFLSFPIMMLLHGYVQRHFQSRNKRDNAW